MAIKEELRVLDPIQTQKRGGGGGTERGTKDLAHVPTATYFFLPKKHIPMLFQSGGLSGTAQAATRYLVRATSKSPCVCIMLPAAKIAFNTKTF